MERIKRKNLFSNATFALRTLFDDNKASELSRLGEFSKWEGQVSSENNWVLFDQMIVSYL